MNAKHETYRSVPPASRQARTRADRGRSRCCGVGLHGAGRAARVAGGGFVCVQRTRCGTTTIDNFKRKPSVQTQAEVGDAAP